MPRISSRKLHRLRAALAAHKCGKGLIRHILDRQISYGVSFMQQYRRCRFHSSYHSASYKYKYEYEYEWRKSALRDAIAGRYQNRLLIMALKEALVAMDKQHPPIRSYYDE